VQGVELPLQLGQALPGILLGGLRLLQMLVDQLQVISSRYHAIALLPLGNRPPGGRHQVVGGEKAARFDAEPVVLDDAVIGFVPTNPLEQGFLDAQAPL